MKNTLSTFAILAFLINPANAAGHLSFKEALPVLKNAAIFVDTKIIDPMIITTCSSTLAVLGESVVTNFFGKYYGNYNVFKADVRFEDNIGLILGASAGYEIGKHIVELRHMITDPIFSTSSQLLATLLDASVTVSRSAASRFGTYCSGWLTRGDAWLRQFC